MSERCDGCQHWLKDGEDWEAAATGFGTCKAVIARWKIQDAVVPMTAADLSVADDGESYLQKRKVALQKARAYVQDGSEYYAELITGPDFFCALYASKDAAP